MKKTNTDDLTHDIVWDDNEVSRLWNYYSLTLGDRYLEFPRSSRHVLLSTMNRRNDLPPKK